MLLVISILGFLALLIFGLILSGNTHIFRGVKVVYFKGHLSTYINDWPQFDNRIIKTNPNQRQEWKLSAEYNKTRPTARLQRLHQKMGSIAFLIIRNDQIWSETYFEEYDQNSKTNSFSMAKSITTALLGKAIEQGKIKGLDQKVCDFFPEVHPDLTVGDLASMYSGMKWNENYDNPVSSVAKIYLHRNIREFILKQSYSKKPGTTFHYNSGNTLLLGMVIEKATGQNLSTYLSEHFWQPMGMRADALWELDSKENGMEKSYCCIASNARDFAKFGKLFMQEGRWNDQQLLAADFVKKCIQPRFPENPQYGYGFWLTEYLNKKIFLMYGILGQYVICIPEDELVIVRLGHKRDICKDHAHITQDFFVYVDEAYQMIETEQKLQSVSQRKNKAV